MMTNLIFITLIIFIFGLIVGSFLNSVVYRIKHNRKIINDRSICPHCQQKLAWFDLIPVVSFFLLKGRCRYCKKPISWQYPLVEFLTGIVFILPLLLSNNFLKVDIFQLNFWINYCYYLFISSVLIIIFVYDFKYYLIPDKILIFGLLIIVLWNLFLLPHLIWDKLFGALLFAGFFLFQYLISHGKWIGFGDVKLAALLGFILGWKFSLLSLFLSYLIGGIISMGLIILKKKTPKSEIPFGPILILSFFIAFLWGKNIISWYLNLIS